MSGVFFYETQCTSLPGFADGGQQTELNQLLLGSKPDLQMHVKYLRSSVSKNRRATNCLFSDSSHLEKTSPDDEKYGRIFTHLP